MTVSRADANSTPDPRLSLRPVVDASLAETAPTMAGDQLVSSNTKKKRDKAIGNRDVDKLSDGVGVQGAARDTSDFLARWASMAGRESRFLNTMMGFFAGDRAQVERSVGAAASKVNRAANAAHATAVARATSPVSKAASATLRFLGKAGPILSVPFAFYDVAKAWTEPDAKKKDSAWMNATFTVGGTALGLAALAFPPAAIPLLIGSAGVALLQLADTYIFKGKVMDYLGEHVMHPIRHLFGRN